MRCTIRRITVACDEQGNVTNEPLFVAQACGNYRLRSNSPCINAGGNAYVGGNTDLDGNPRIVAAIVDIGAESARTNRAAISADL